MKRLDSQSPAGRIDRWHRKLLDLTLRNRLLNFRATKKTVPLHGTNLAELENRLSRGKRLKLISQLLPSESETTRETAELTSEVAIDVRQPSDRDDVELATALDRNEIVARVDEAELLQRLTAIYRGVRNDLAETGTNTLFLAVGFLQWKQSPSDSRTRRAPLLLLPVKLLRSGGRSNYRLANHEDDIRFNATLIQKLKREFDCDLTAFEFELPTDSHGIDVERVFVDVESAVAGLAEFSVVRDSALALFSFSKYLMWKDLVDRSDQLERNRVVRHLIHGNQDSFRVEGVPPISTPDEIDQRFEPEELYLPLPADSSQLSAVMAAADGHDLVLIGPPGTGKSQTITNMIAQCLANQKTVLFVAEKTAALDVVHRRLVDCGLGNLCLELHSSKTDRRSFLEQMQRSWLSGFDEPGKCRDDLFQRVKGYRDRINEYVDAVHALHANGWTAYRGFGVAAQEEELDLPGLNWAHDENRLNVKYAEYHQLIDQLRSLDDVLRELVRFDCVAATEWSAAWEQDLLRNARHVRDAAALLASELGRFNEDVIRFRFDSLDSVQSTLKMLKLLSLAATQNFSAVLDPQLPRLTQASERLAANIALFENASESITATFSDEVLRDIKIDELQERWSAAERAFWPFSYFGKRAVRKQLQKLTRSGQVDPARDLNVLRTMQLELLQIDSNPLSVHAHLWNHRFTDTESLVRHLQLCVQLSTLLQTAVDDSQSQRLVRQRLGPLLSRRSPGHPMLERVERLQVRVEEFLQTLEAYRDLAKCYPFGESADDLLSETQRSLESLSDNRESIASWVTWFSAANQARQAGLEAVIDSIEQGAIPIEECHRVFETIYANWWVPAVVDESEVLRSFRLSRHEKCVDQYRSLEQKLKDSAVRRVCEQNRHGLAHPDDVKKRSDLGTLKHQIGLKRPSKSIRQVIDTLGSDFTKLAPCVLMSPLSIAQYLPASQQPFDVIIFDEASQITTWDAIGAIARGTQTIVVGDPKQLPPTHFFDLADDDDEEFDELLDSQRDQESILEEASHCGLPTLRLNWHYRSRYESLIEFSNRSYYNHELITFPASSAVDTALTFRHLPDAIYHRGKTRTNAIEAQAIVDEAVAMLIGWLDRDAEQRPTLGVITFNIQQQSLIEDLFDVALENHPELGWYFSEDRYEPVVVKNLENVQGDERDVMLFSITYGPNDKGRVPLTFGALNREGGERRLNVAITRARERLLVYSSFRSEQLDVGNTDAKGVIDLKRFLEFAECHSEDPARDDIYSNDPLRRLELVVAERLQEAGWNVDFNVGRSTSRVSLAVRDPNDSERYLAGIEFDGETYLKCATASDREVTRPNGLMRQGWEIVRVWSRAWWQNPAGEANRLDETLRAIADAKSH